MHSYQIISDSSCDLPAELLQTLQVGIVPYYASFDTVQYHKELLELTAETFTEDGWFKTGDLGSFDKKNRLAIRGRIKTMILGASGENIYPEEIESIINNFRFVNESLVVENSGKLVAMVHFNMEELEKQYQKLKDQAGNYKEKINDYIEEQKQELRDYVNARVNNFSKLQLVLVQHEPFEKIKRFLYCK